MARIPLAALAMAWLRRARSSEPSEPDLRAVGNRHRAAMCRAHLCAAWNARHAGNLRCSPAKMAPCRDGLPPAMNRATFKSNKERPIMRDYNAFRDNVLAALERVAGD